MAIRNAYRAPAFIGLACAVGVYGLMEVRNNSSGTDEHSASSMYSLAAHNLDGGQELTKGLAGQRVGVLQQAIGSLGCMEVPVDSDFGDKTEKAVAEVQKAAHLNPVNGKANKATQAAIIKGIAEGVNDCWGTKQAVNPEPSSTEKPSPTAEQPAPTPAQPAPPPAQPSAPPAPKPLKPVAECMRPAYYPDTQYLQTAKEIPPLPGGATRYKTSSTIYFPENPNGNPALEGGMDDRKCKEGLVNHSLQDYLEGKTGDKGEGAYAALAMDPNALPYGTVVRIPEIEEKYKRPIAFEIVDTGSAFQGKGTGRIDIMVRQSKGNESLSRKTFTLVVIHKP